MATSFPSGLDSLTNPSSGDSLSSPSHSAQHANVNDAVEALQAKVGVDGSAVTSSLDYQLANIGTWTAYTPTFNNMTVTTSAARYCQINKTIFLALYFVVSAVSGPPGISVPSGLNISRFTNYQTIVMFNWEKLHII